MSVLELSEKSGKIKDVYFAYVRLKNPVKKYSSDDKEFCVSCVVDKATAKALKKALTKISIKEVDTIDFESVYKFAPPFPDQDEQFIITFRADSHYKDGKEKEYKFNTRPKAYIPSGDKVEDVTLQTFVGNGSFGDVAFFINHRETGIFSRLMGILVKELVASEISSSNSVKHYNPFGEVINNEELQEPEEESPF